MSVRCFFDSNLLIYLYDLRNSEKTRQVQNTIDQTPVGIISTQVLAEFCNVSLKRLLVSSNDVFVALAELQRSFKVHINTADTIEQAVALQQKFRFSFYDSMILAAAFESGCETVYSEDMAHNQLIDGRLRIVNPFL